MNVDLEILFLNYLTFNIPRQQEFYLALWQGHLLHTENSFLIRNSFQNLLVLLFLSSGFILGGHPDESRSNVILTCEIKNT